MIERADAVWVVSVHDREIDARLAEATLAAKYGLPTMPFVAVAGSRGETSIVSSQRHINQLFAACETGSRGHRLLEEEGLVFDLPHYQPKARTMLARDGEARHVVNLALCAARSGATVLHRVAVRGSDAEAGERSNSSDSGSEANAEARADGCSTRCDATTVRCSRWPR